MRRQCCDGGGMLGRNRELVETRLPCRADEGCEIDAELRPERFGLDRDFPDAHGREENLVVRGFDRIPRRTGQAPRLRQRPKQDVRVEQETHQRPSNAAITSSGSGASKSCGTRSFPLRRPSVRLPGALPIGTSLATGRPAFAMTTSSPSTTSSMSRERFVLAAWMFTVLMNVIWL